MDSDLLLAIALVGAAVAILVAEFFIVSFGLLSIAALGTAASAIYIAFNVSEGTGWLFGIGTPVLLVLVTRWGVRRVRSSPLVPRAEITADAGYHHAAEQRGATVGAHGVMVTPAHPTGRARFDAGECDVTCAGTSLESGSRIIVTGIDGPVIRVVPLATTSPAEQSSD